LYAPLPHALHAQPILMCHLNKIRRRAQIIKLPIMQSPRTP
jgi:hypothetical protein